MLVSIFFSVRVIMVWNKLPDDIFEAPSNSISFNKLKLFDRSISILVTTWFNYIPSFLIGLFLKNLLIFEFIIITMSVLLNYFYIQVLFFYVVIHTLTHTHLSKCTCIEAFCYSFSNIYGIYVESTVIG